MGTLYLDVDGVCNYLHEDPLGSLFLLVPDLRPKLQEFLRAGHKIKWLTCHTPADAPMESRSFVGFCGVNQLQVMMGFDYNDPNFEYATWRKLSGGNKTRGIDLLENFVWIEDGILPKEKQILKDWKCLDCYFETNPRYGLTWAIATQALLKLEKANKELL